MSFFDVEMIFIFIEKLNFGNTLLLFFEKDTQVINISQSTYFSRDKPRPPLSSYWSISIILVSRHQTWNLKSSIFSDDWQADLDCLLWFPGTLFFCYISKCEYFFVKCGKWTHNYVFYISIDMIFHLRSISVFL